MILRHIPSIVIIDPAAKTLVTLFIDSGFMFPSFNVMNLIILMETENLKRGTRPTCPVHSFSISFTAFSSLVLVTVSVTSLMSLYHRNLWIYLSFCWYKLNCCVENLYRGFNTVKRVQEPSRPTPHAFFQHSEAMKCNIEQVQENHFCIVPSSVLTI